MLAAILPLPAFLCMLMAQGTASAVRLRSSVGVKRQGAPARVVCTSKFSCRQPSWIRVAWLQKCWADPAFELSRLLCVVRRPIGAPYLVLGVTCAATYAYAAANLDLNRDLGSDGKSVPAEAPICQMKYHPVGSSLLDEEPDRRSRGGWSHRLVALYYPLPASVSERASERFIVRTRTVRVWDV